MIQIVPAILATSEEEYKDKLQEIESSPAFKDGWVQIDLMDYKFVQNRSIGLDVVAKYPAPLKLEAHLMVDYPENWIDELVKTHVQRIIFPIEDAEGTLERISHIKNHAIETGLSLNPETDVASIKPFINQLDAVLVMSVNPGFSGQDFIPEVLDKVGKIKRLCPDLAVGVDGGIKLENVKLVVDAGADYIVIGSGLFEYDNLEEGLEKIWKAIYG